jgi:hypothetical protein
MLAMRYGTAQAIYEWSSRTASWSRIASTDAWSGPIYSRDGRSVIGASINGIGVVGLRGGTARIIGLPGDSPQGISPGGNEVIFSAYGRIGSDCRPAFPWLLWSVLLDSSAVTQRTRGIGAGGIETRDDFGGAYLPDGRAAIIERRSSDFSTIVVARIDLTRNTVNALITPPRNRVYLGPSLDARAERITFLQCAGTGTTYDESSCEVMIAAVDGTGVRQVTSRAASRGWPSFTPDGASLVVGEGRTLGESRLMLVDVASGSESSGSRSARTRTKRTQETARVSCGSCGLMGTARSSCAIRSSRQNRPRQTRRAPRSRAERALQRSLRGRERRSAPPRPAAFAWLSSRQLAHRDTSPHSSASSTDFTTWAAGVRGCQWDSPSSDGDRNIQVSWGMTAVHNDKTKQELPMS